MLMDLLFFCIYKGFAERSVRMLGSDVVVMWVDDNGSVRAQDSYITDRAAGMKTASLV